VPEAGWHKITASRGMPSRVREAKRSRLRRAGRARSLPSYSPGHWARVAEDGSAVAAVSRWLEAAGAGRWRLNAAEVARVAAALG
jgi:hypothetical protein